MSEENKQNNPVRNHGSQSEPVSNGTGKSDAALREERILEFWKENKIFSKTLNATKGKKEFIFYEGPPTANGKPGIHHLEARAFKDAIPRYKTMRGFHVRRKGGWDTHGLAVEIQTEKKLGLNSKKAIEEYGIEKFNQECKESVWEYLDAWNKFTKRIGYWVDQENPYVTYHNDYIESVWNIVKKINDKNLLYKDYKVVPWCPRCGTALSTHELAQGYEDVKDLSVYVKFKIVESDAFSQSLGPSLRSATPSKKHTDSTPCYFLAWTTTPWTLPGNVALAVGKDIDYVKIKIGNERYILAKARLSTITKPYEIVAEHKGSEMVGMQYEPLFPFLVDTISESEKSKMDKAYKVYTADFVTTVDGTGIVHTAVMYGQDDFELGTKIGLPKHHLVNLEGKFVKDTGFLEGRFVKEKDENGKPILDVDIIKYLTDKNLFFKKENYEHSYPHCWRCHTALIYYARDSWYIKVSDPKIKGEMIEENQGINWEPAHIRDGRFGEWLREIKDWAISRERYWGTPLPVWECKKCNTRQVIGSIEELKKRTKKSGNKYFVMRHGEAIDNAKHLNDPKGDPNNHLTAIGERETVDSARKIKNEKIDLIFSSPFLRTRETAEILRRELGLKEEQLIIDNRLHESNEGNPDLVAKRMGEFIYEVESKFQNKNIIIISHGSPIWVVQRIAAGKSHENFTEKEMFYTAEIEELLFAPIPHNENYKLDLHKPFIDDISLVCPCGGDLARVKEVMDVWFDSGAMPFSQDHYPFEIKKPIYPSDFICEAIDQTRGWFYTLHAIGVLMGYGKAFKNVICLGHLLDAQGKKMSKSLGNVVDPWLMMEKYGADTLRLWMYSVNQPGESKNFDEKTVALLHGQVFGLLYNVLAFYELYRDRSLEKDYLTPSPLSLIRRGVGERSNVLDVWILARLDELVELSTKNMDSYKLLEPVRGIRDFVGDLSTWYLRRSRERIKEEAANLALEQAQYGARQTLYFVLKTLAKIMAPFAPFTAEDIWLRLKTERDEESVHLENWPKMSKPAFDIFGREKKARKKILEEMAKVREVVTEGLELRQKAKIQVRQPVSKISSTIAMPAGLGLYTIVKDELNAKLVLFNQPVKDIDTNITPELKQEGNYRELVRALQDMRKKIGLTPSDVVSLVFETDEEGRKLIQKFESDMKKTVLASKIEFKENNGEEIKIDNIVFKIKIEK